MISGCLMFILASVVGLLTQLLQPAVVFGMGYLSGVILDFFCGDIVVKGLNCMLNTTRFDVYMLPAMCGVLALIGFLLKGSFFSRFPKVEVNDGKTDDDDNEIHDDIK